MRVQALPVGAPCGLMERARRELLARGYLLGVEDEARVDLPAATQLEDLLRERIQEDVARPSGRRYSLSFLKTGDGIPQHDGFHLDTHPEITAHAGVELARVLVNLSDAPRRLRFARTDRFELADLGVHTNRGDHQVVELPDGIETAEIEIPGRSEDESVVHGLRFWASVVPHVGAEEEDEYFLASYEAVVTYGGEA